MITIHQLNFHEKVAEYVKNGLEQTLEAPPPTSLSLTRMKLACQPTTPSSVGLTGPDVLSRHSLHRSAWVNYTVAPKRWFTFTSAINSLNLQERIITTKSIHHLLTCLKFGKDVSVQRNSNTLVRTVRWMLGLYRDNYFHYGASAPSSNDSMPPFFILVRAPGEPGVWWWSGKVDCVLEDMCDVGAPLCSTAVRWADPEVRMTGRVFKNTSLRTHLHSQIATRKEMIMESCWKLLLLPPLSPTNLM